MSKKNIKILIACHKPSELPKNDLFLPVRVGAALAKDDLGLQRDDDGKDNISAKNPKYCELTAIYWAWKNLKADYYGLFHYRRFYSFSDRKFPVSDDGHMMIRAKILAPKIFAKYGLDDSAKMRQMIENNDIIVHESRRVSGIPTPMGIPGRTVREHYRYHDGTIVKNSDIDLMMQIVKQKYPAVHPYIEDYLNSSKFLGYNMFIMKRKYFMGMCDFLFGVLGDIEDKIDDTLSERSLNSNRIYGYLAEILTSAYIYYIRKTNTLRVKELQMIYALKTDPIRTVSPKMHCIPIVFDLTTNVVPNLEFYLETTLRRAIQMRDKQVKYDVLIVHDKIVSKVIADEYMKLANDNVSIRFVDYSDYLDQMREIYGIDNIGFKLVAPWVLNSYKRAIILSWNVWTNSSLESLYDVNVNKYCVAAAQNILTLGGLFEVNTKNHISHAQKLANDYSINPQVYFDSSVLIENLEKIREEHTLDDIVDAHANMHNEGLIDRDILNVLYMGKTLLLDQSWNYQLPTDKGINYLGSFFAPIAQYNAWKNMNYKYRIGKFSEDQITWPRDSEFMLEFYRLMSAGELWPMFLIKRDVTFPVRKLSLRDRIAPQGSLRRRVAKILFPKGSWRRSTLAGVYHRIRG